MSVVSAVAVKLAIITNKPPSQIGYDCILFFTVDLLFTLPVQAGYQRYRDDSRCAAQRLCRIKAAQPSA